MTELQIKHMQLNLETQYNDAPKKIKITSKFAEYLNSTPSILHEKPKGFLDSIYGIPIEIDDEINDECYELVY